MGKAGAFIECGALPMKSILYSSLIVLIASGALGDDIPADSDISAVTLYPAGAMVTRTVPFQTNAGDHRILIADMPDYFDFQTMRITGQGAFTLGAFELRDVNLAPSEPVETPESRALKDEIERLEDAITVKDYEVEAATLRQRAADAQLAFLNAIGQAKAADQLDAASVDDLRAIAAMIGAESLAALEQAHQSRIDATALRGEANDLREDLNKARQELAALLLPVDDSPQLAVRIAADTDVSGSLEVSYYIDEAGWTPIYDFSLMLGDVPALTIDRNVRIAQNSGENWANVAMTLSTAMPSFQSAPSYIGPIIARIDPPIVYAERSASLADGAMLAAPMEMVVEAPMMADRSQARAALQGLTVIYNMPDTVNLAGDGTPVQLALDSKETSPEISALAVPRSDPSAFFMAHITNDSGEIYLPGTVRLFRDGAMVGETQLELTAAGASVDMAFGAIEGLQVSRRILSREEGNTGVFTSSNRRGDQFEITAKNLTGQPFELRILDRYPVSEQEDLVIDRQANPRVTEVDVDGKRGVVAWDILLAPGQEQQISFGYEIGWPTGMELQIPEN